jgi:hypothetical protein
MSTRAVAPTASVSKPARSNSKATGFEAQVLGESDYDKVTAMLMAVVMGALMVVALMGVVYITNQAYASRVTTPLQIIEVVGGGGTPEGTPGSAEKVDVAGADPKNLASNNEEEAGDFEEPAVETTPGAMLDAAAEAGSSLAEVDLGPAMPHGGPQAGGKRASKIGSGGPGLGMGPGDGGVARELRWSIIFNSDQTIEEYARQLDGLSVELAVVLDQNQLTYVSNFSSAEPTKRYGTGQGDHRLYFIWQGRGRKATDLALLRKAGIDVGDKIVLQFYPAGAEAQLASLEQRYKGRLPNEIRVTRFSVVPRGNGYGFQVMAQETLR